MASTSKDQKESKGSSFFGFNFFEFSEGFQLTAAEKNVASDDTSDDASEETSDSSSSDEETISSDDVDTYTDADADTLYFSDTNTADEEETSASLIRNQRGCINAILGSNTADEAYGTYNDEKTVEDTNSYVYDPPIALRKKRAVLPGRINKYSLTKEREQTNKVEASDPTIPSVTNNDALFQQLLSADLPEKTIEPRVEMVAEIDDKKIEKPSEASKRKKWRLFQRKRKDNFPRKVPIPGKLPQARSSKKAKAKEGTTESSKKIKSQKSANNEKIATESKETAVNETFGSLEQSLSSYLALSNIFYKNNSASKETEKVLGKPSVSEFREERNSILDDSFSCSLPADQTVKRQSSEASKTLLNLSKKPVEAEIKSDNLVETESAKSIRKESTIQPKQEEKIYRIAPKKNLQVEKRDERDDQDLYASIMEHVQREAASTNKSVSSRRSSNSKAPVSPKLRRPPRPDVRDNTKLPPMRSKLQIQPKTSTRTVNARSVRATGTQQSSRMDQTIQGKRCISQAHLYPENLSFGDEDSEFGYSFFSLGSMNPY